MRLRLETVDERLRRIGFKKKTRMYKGYIFRKVSLLCKKKAFIGSTVRAYL